MDVDAIEPGVNFKELIEESLAEVEALIAVIGRGWLTTADADGQRRLDDERDFVRLEIAQALDRNIRVVPVLVNGAGLPRAADLPADLIGLTDRNALELKQTEWRAGVARLVTSLERLIGPVAGEPAPSDRPTAEAPVAGEPVRLLAGPAAEAPWFLLKWLNPGEELEDWFDIYLDAERETHMVVALTATRMFSSDEEHARRARTPMARIDFADVTSIGEAETAIGAPLGPDGLRLFLKNGGWFEFIPCGNRNKVLAELQSRVTAASS
jgi:hypothetical protein